MITNAKLSIPNEDTSGKPQFLFGDSNPNGTSIFNWEKEHWYYTQGDRRYYLPAIEHQVSFMYLQPLTVPHLMHYTLTNKEDSVKVGSLKYDGGFCLKGLYGVNVIGLRSSFVLEDAPVNKVDVVLNISGNKLAKTDAQYPDGGTSFPGWIKSMDTQWWTHLVNFPLVTFEGRLRRLGLYSAMRASKYCAEICAPTLYSIFELYNVDSNTFFPPAGEIGIALHKMFEVSHLPMGDRPYEEFFLTNVELNTYSQNTQVGEAFRELVCQFLICQRTVANAGHDSTVAHVPWAKYLFPNVSKKGNVDSIHPVVEAKIGT